MLNEYIKNIKDKFIKKSEGNNKKNIENLVVFLVLLIITVIAINTIWGNDKHDIKNENENNQVENNEYKKLAINNSKTISNNVEENEYNLEEKLEDILSKISGVGKIKVLITYSETSQVVAMYNEKSIQSSTEESDTNGGTRKIEQIDNNREIIYEEKNGEKTPITQKVLLPKIEGAIITAEGAKNANIKTCIIEAVSAATGLPTYRIQVFEMSN